MNAVAKRPEVPCESQAFFLTPPPYPLPLGEREARVGQSLPGRGARVRQRRKGRRAARGDTGGRGSPGRWHRSRAPRPDRPLNPLCPTATRTAARLSLHASLSPLSQHRQPSIPTPATRDHRRPSLPPRFPAGGRAASPTTQSQLVSPRPRTHTQPAALHSHSCPRAAVIILPPLSRVEHALRPPGCGYCPVTQGDGRAWQRYWRSWDHPLISPGVSFISPDGNCPCPGNKLGSLSRA